MCPVDTCTHHTMKGFTAYHSLRRHFLRTHVARTLSCPKAGCNKRFSFPADLKAHLQFCGQKLYCEICGQILSAPSSLRIHKMRKHNINNSTNSYTEENFKPILHLKNNDFIIRRDGEEDEDEEEEEEEEEIRQQQIQLQQQQEPPPPQLIKPKTQKLDENISVSYSGFFIPPFSSSSSSFEFLIPSSNHKSSFTPVIPSSNTLSVDNVNNYENTLNSFSLERPSLNLANNSNINITPIKKKQVIFPESITTASVPPPIPLQLSDIQQQILPKTTIKSQNSQITFISPISTPITPPPPPPSTPCTTPNNNQYNSNYNLSFFPPLPPPPTTLFSDDDFQQQQQQLFMNNYMMAYPNNNNSMYNNNIFPK